MWRISRPSSFEKLGDKIAEEEGSYSRKESKRQEQVGWGDSEDRIRQKADKDNNARSSLEGSNGQKSWKQTAFLSRQEETSPLSEEIVPNWSCRIDEEHLAAILGKK